MSEAISETFDPHVASLMRVTSIRYPPRPVLVVNSQGVMEREYLVNAELAAIEGFGDAGVAKLVDARDLSASKLSD